jgi:hypothetical protein
VNYYIGVHMSTHLSGSHRRNWYAAFSLVLGVIVALGMAKEVYNAIALRRKQQVCYCRPAQGAGLCDRANLIEDKIDSNHVPTMRTCCASVGASSECCHSCMVDCRPMLEAQQSRCLRRPGRLMLVTAV